MKAKANVKGVATLPGFSNTLHSILDGPTRTQTLGSPPASPQKKTVKRPEAPRLRRWSVGVGGSPCREDQFPYG